MSDRAPFDRRGVARWVRAIVFCFLLMGLSYGTWLGRLPSLRDALEASTLQMSLYGLCLAAGSIAGLLVAGPVVQRIGARRAIALTVLVQVVALPGTVIALLVGAAPLGFAALFVYGFSFSTTDIAVNVSGANAERADGRPRLSLMHAGYSLGVMLAMGVGAAAEAFSVPLPLHAIVTFAVIAVGVFAVIGRVPRDELAVRADGERALDLSGAVPVIEADTRDDAILNPATGAVPIISRATAEAAAAAGSGSATGTGTGTSTSTGTDTDTGTTATGATGSASHPAPPRRYSPWRNPGILLIGAITLAAGLLEGTPADWLPLALVDGHGVTNAFGTVMLGVFYGSVVLARLVGSPLLSRFGRVVVLRGSFVLAALGVLAVVLAPGPIGIIAGTLAWGLGTGVCWPVTISAAADNPETAVLDVAAVSAVGYTSMLLGPMLFGLVGEHLGLLQAFWALPVIALVGVLLAGRTRPDARLRTHPGGRPDARPGGRPGAS